MAHVVVNGARLWYEVRGKGEPLLLHHGYTASRVNWMPVAERLQSKYQVILMECRGTGESEHTADGYTLEQYAADVIGVADHLGLDTFTFAGHSMGGGIGYVLALTYPARLRRLILMAPVPADGFPGNPPAPAQPTEADRPAALAQAQLMRFRPESETDEWFEDRIRHRMTVSNGHFVDGFSAMRDLRVRSRLGEIMTPTLMVAGAVDGLLTANLHDFGLLPNATLEVLSRAGHEVAIHEPERVAEAIDGFMQNGVITAKTLQSRLAGAGPG